MISVLLFLKAQQKNKVYLFFSLLSFLFALFSYEVSWTLPFIILSITIFIAYIKKESFKKNMMFALPYFLLFAAWFIIKVVILNKFAVTDYDDNQFLKISFITIAKNNAVLFLRNFIPPFKNTATFVCVGAAFVVIIVLALAKLARQNSQLFYFLLLLITLTIFGFIATSLIGIDSHDSESERYIYFSSAFGIMFLSVLLVGAVKNKTVMIATVVAVCSYYAYTLFKTIGYYKKASEFSQTYLKEINKKVTDGETILFINQPAQYKGALLFRAESRMNKNTSDRISILQEYFSYLYNKQDSCITFSSKELLHVPAKLMVVEKPVDSITVYFPEIKNNQSALKKEDEKIEFAFSKNSSLIYVGLKDSTLFFFK
ncbi:MAG: hypothetical protein WDM90_07035 [Ferruginibacter sp.]